MKDTEQRIKIIALFGESGAGKDTTLKVVSDYFQNDLNKIVSYTTRPIRNNEEDGHDYRFITREEFFSKEMIIVSEFNDWYYGTSLDCFSKDKINIGVFDISRINALIQNEEIEVYPIYITARPPIRLARALQREEEPDCLEICRRHLADAQDYLDIPFDYITLENNTYQDFNKIISSIERVIKLFNN